MSSTRAPRIVPERLLRRLWIEQAYPALHLRTLDGRSLNIILPGTLNRNSGPDFIGARVRIGDTLYAGDIELHRGNRDWHEHRHHKDPRYNSVILHVVFDRAGAHRPPLTQSGRPLPVLVLSEFVSRTRVRSAVGSASGSRREGIPPLRCRGLNSCVGAHIVRSWLIRLSRERLEAKIRRFGERLNELSRRRGLRTHERFRFPGESPLQCDEGEISDPANLADWEQLLYEGIMEALGYENNQAPFLRLARSCTLAAIERCFSTPAASDPVPLLEAALFKIAGLLHDDVRGKESVRRLRFLRNLWTLAGGRFAGEYLSATDWQFFRMRPENFPTIRLAGAARLLPSLMRKSFFRHMMRIICREVLSPKQRYVILEGLLLVPAGGYWKTHYRFGERARSQLKTLIGRGRAGEIIVNAVLPVFLLYARVFNDRKVEEGAHHVLDECPPGIENRITAIVASQLVRDRFTLESSALQQGALQLYNRYCAAGRCSECAVGSIVFGAARGPRN